MPLSPLLSHVEMYRWEFEWGVLPTKSDEKRPAVRWRQYVTSLPSDVRTESWAESYWQPEKGGIAVVTGPVSRLVVVDIDRESAAAYLHSNADIPRTATVETRRGKHLYFETTRPIRSSSDVHGVKGLDVRGVGGCVVAPPSPFIDGTGEYRWLIDPRNALAPLPEHLADLLGSAPQPTVTAADLFTTIREGQRNDELMRRGGVLLANRASESDVTGILLAMNVVCCRPQLSRKEVEGIIASLLKRHRAGGTTLRAFDDNQAALLSEIHKRGQSLRAIAHMTGRGRSTVERAISAHRKRSASYTIGRGQREGSKRRPGGA